MVRASVMVLVLLAGAIPVARTADSQPPAAGGRRLTVPGAPAKPLAPAPGPTSPVTPEQRRTAPGTTGEPWLRIGLWGGWGSASLRQVDDDTEAHLKAMHVGTTEYFTIAGGLGTPVEKEYASAAAGLNLGVEAGFLVTRSVMVETAGGRPRDIWVGARLGILRPGETRGRFSAFNALGEGAQWSRRTSTSLTTLMFGGWFQGGKISGLHGRVSLFAGPAFASATVHDRGVIMYTLTGREESWDITHDYSGRTLAFAVGLELAYSLTRHLAVFVDGGYHWARFKNMKEAGRPAERVNGLEAVYDFTGASVNGGLKVSLWGQPGGRKTGK